MKKIESEIEKIKKFLLDLFSTIEEINIYLEPDNQVYNILVSKLKSNYSINSVKESALNLLNKLKLQFLNRIDSFTENDIKKLKNFIVTDLTLFVEIFNSFFAKIISNSNSSIKKNLSNEDPLYLIKASYFLLNLNFKSLKNIVNRYFDVGFVEHEELEIKPENESIWDTSNMKYKEFKSDIKKIKEYTEEILNEADDSEAKSNPVLFLQISEFIKNAIRHGNKFDKNKKVKIWFNINSDFAKLIIEDEGEGFKNLEEWNRFNKLRNKYIREKDLQNALKYAVYKSIESLPEDGGNFLFSALEYWDSGVIFNPKRNKIAVIKYFY